MFELLLLVVLVAVVAWSLRPRKSELLSPLVIDNPHYHLTLDPALSDEQSMFDEMAAAFAALPLQRGDAATRYFQISPNTGNSKAPSGYLLALSLRHGKLYFQAIRPVPTHLAKELYLPQIRKFAAAVMVAIPFEAGVEESSPIVLQEILQTVARRRQRAWVQLDE